MRSQGGSRLGGIAEISQPLAVFKHGWQTVRWRTPELLRP
jgi:hypothetical protein